MCPPGGVAGVSYAGGRGTRICECVWCPHTIRFSGDGSAVGDERWARATQWFPASPPFTAALTQPQPDITVCTVVGGIDVDTASVLDAALTRALRDDNGNLVIDLSAVTSMTAEGLYTLLVARHRHGMSAGGYLAVVMDPYSPTIPELLAVSLTASFDSHRTLPAALRAVSALRCAGPDEELDHTGCRRRRASQLALGGVEC